ncbi:MAG: 2,3-bisphosphoglycerate-independent phosphoglycerate mutase [Gemmatimonadetes bacterium]|nr:2,3-bisphosphoglycerate-independent phosphoglycerate mutase [Gemmatimonadota bacterium]
MGCRRVGLIVLDGWGLRESRGGNAVALARTPVFDELWEKYPRTTLDVSGRAVGLRDGMMGNSEVGHLNLGAGRVVKQDILRVDEAIESGELFEKEPLRRAAERVRRGATLHLIGLVSDGGVHSHLDHLIALLEFARREQLERVAVHAFTDGRDTSPTCGAGFLVAVRDAIEAAGVGVVATVVGRYYAMDRDRRWDRTRVAYEALTRGRAERTVKDPVAGLRASYEAEVTDEFVKPIVIEDTPRIESGDVVVFFNFRADRARQLTRAFTEEGFEGFDREPPADLLWITMTQYDRRFDLPVLFEPKESSDVAGDVWERAGCTNLRIAETEKYAHVTYFFNGGREAEYEGEDRILVPSPQVATYDLQPEMSAREVTDRLVERLRSDPPDVFVLNYANPDMVGHTGILDAAIVAVETTDECLGRVVSAFRDAAPDGALLILADHGNAETLVQADGSPHTAHTTNPVPCLLVSEGARGSLRDGGSLRDAVPTLLALQGIEKPEAMNGRDLREALKE